MGHISRWGNFNYSDQYPNAINPLVLYITKVVEQFVKSHFYSKKKIMNFYLSKTVSYENNDYIFQSRTFCIMFHEKIIAKLWTVCEPAPISWTGQICFGTLYLWVIFLIKFVFKFCFSQIFFREGKSRSKKYQTNDIDFHCALFWRQIITEQNSLYIPIFDQYKHLYWSIILYIYIIKEYFVPDSLADCFCTLEILSRNI